MSSPGGSPATLLPRHCFEEQQKSYSGIRAVFPRSCSEPHSSWARKEASSGSSKQSCYFCFLKDLGMSNFSGSVHGLRSGSSHPIVRHNKWTTAGPLVVWYHGVCSSAGEGFSPGWRVSEADMQNRDFSNPWCYQWTPTQICGIPLHPFKLSGKPWLCPHASTALTRGVDLLACWSWSVATIAVLS